MTKFVIPKSGATTAVWWPAKIRVPQDGGAVDEQDLNVRFEIISDAALQETLRTSGVHGALKRVTLAWQAVDGQGADVPFDRFEEIAAIPYVREGLFDAYLACASGAPRKN